MGELAFRKIQYGLENPAAHGTAVAATDVFPGKIVVPVDRKIVFPELTTGRRARSQAGIVNQIHVDGFTMSLDPGIFQMLPLLFSCGIKGAITPVEQTPDQDDYLWDFTHSLTATNAPDSATVEFGDDTQAYEIEYAMARSYKIAGNLGEDAPVTVEAELFGKQISTASFTGSLAPVAYEYMHANMSKLWIDSTWATLGTTQKTGLLQGFSVEIQTGVHPKFHAAGVKTMTSHGQGYLDCVATLTLEGNSDADAIWDDFRAGTKRAIRLQVLGSQIGSGDPYSLEIDMFGQFESVIPLSSEKSGNNLHAAIFHCLDDNQATPHNFAVKVTTKSNSV